MNIDDMVLTRRGLRFAGRYWPCSIGRGGLTTSKREGDGATPVGTHRITGLLYRPDRLKKPVDWAVAIRPGDLWSDDPTDEDYNLMVRLPYTHSYEHLRRADPLYDVILTTDWNWPYALPGAGSAIFLHQWRRPGTPTEGCIAVSRSNLNKICKKISYSTRLVIPPTLAP